MNGKDWQYAIEGNTLLIYINRATFTIDLLPSIFKEILDALWLETAEGINAIKLVMGG